MLMKNRRHLGFSTSVRTTPNLQIESGHHHPYLTGIKGDGLQIRMTGVLSYRNGSAEFDARLTESEEEVLRSLIATVADRVHGMILDNNERRRRSRRQRQAPAAPPVARGGPRAEGKQP